MKKIELIPVKRFYLRADQSASVKRAINDIYELNREFPVLDLKVYPYSYPVTIREIVENCSHIDEYSNSSRSIMVSELNGCIEIINTKIDYEAQEDVTVLMLEGKYIGKIRSYKKSSAECLVEIGIAEYV